MPVRDMVHQTGALELPVVPDGQPSRRGGIQHHHADLAVLRQRVAVSLNGLVERGGKPLPGTGQVRGGVKGAAQVVVTVIQVAAAGQDNVAGITGDRGDGLVLSAPDQNGLIAVLDPLPSHQPPQGAVGLLGGLVPDGEGLAGGFKPAAEGEVCAVVAGD